MKKITAKENDKELLFKEFGIIYNEYFDSYHNSNITRDYYIKKSKYSKSSINDVFKTFQIFKEQAFNYLNLNEEVIKTKMIETKNNNLLNNENKILKRELTKLELKDSIENKILTEYKDHLNSLDLTKLKISNEIFKQETRKISILNLSDWHCGEQVKKKELNGINEYNIKIMVERVDRIINDFIYHNQTFGITETNIFFEGDLLAGDIHQELERTNEENVSYILFFLQKYIIEKLLYISQFFNKINVLFVVGNHGRIRQGKPYYKEKVQMNWEYILANQIKITLDLIQKDEKNKKINIDVPESAFSIKEVNGRRFLVTHGEIFSGKSGGGFASIPYYSLVASSAKMYGTLSQIGFDPSLIYFEDCLIGHLHSDASVNMFNGGKMYINGCVIGSSEMSIYGCKSISKIVQNMLIVNSYKNVHAIIPIYGVY
jgi:hypothetical protein